MALSREGDDRGNPVQSAESPKSASRFFIMPIERKASILSPMVVMPYLAAIILSLVSFHTTYYGMRSFYGLGATGDYERSRISDPIANFVSQHLGVGIENLFAVCFAAVVQGGILFASAYLSWLLLNSWSGQGGPKAAMKSRWLRRFVTVILLLLLPISIVFSYGARLEWEIGREQKATIQTSGAHSDATSMMNTLVGMMAEEHQRLSTSVTELPEFKSWTASMDKLARSVARAPVLIRTYLIGTESAEAEKRAAERRRQADASQQALEFDRDADRVKSSLGIIEENIKKFEQLTQSKPLSTTEFDARVAQYEAEMNKEENGTGSCGPAGEGRCFTRYKAERDRAVRERSLFVQSAEAAAHAAADRLTALRKEKIDKEVELANIIDKAKLAGHEIEIDPRAGALDIAVDLPKKIAELQPSLGKYGIEFRKALDELNGGFSLESYARVGEGCRSLLPISMIGDLKESLKGIDCEPSALAPSVAAIKKFEARKERLEGECRSLPPHVGSETADAYISRIYDKVNTCIELSGLGTMQIYRPRITGLSQKLAETMANRSSGVDYLTFTMGELRDGKRVAILALFLAFAIDALVLVFTFLGELPRMGMTVATSTPLPSEERHSTFAQFQAVNDILDTSDPGRFRLARGLLTCIGAPEPDGSIRLDLDKVPNQFDRQDLWRRLVPFVTSGLAWTDPQQKHVIYMSDRAMSLLVHELRRVADREEKAHSEIAEPVQPTQDDPFVPLGPPRAIGPRSQTPGACGSAR